MSNRITYGPKENCTLATCDPSTSVYAYRPSIEANTIFLALFGLSMIIHIAQGIRWRTWPFMIAMVLGCITEMIGYGGRIKLWQNPFSFPGFIMQIGVFRPGRIAPRPKTRLTKSSLHHHWPGLLLCCHLPHTLQDASSLVLYRCPGPWLTSSCNRVIYLGLEYSRFSAKLYYWLFIPCDIVSLILQAAGGAISSSTSGNSKSGVDTAIAGLAFQVFTLIVFIFLTLDYAFRYMRAQRRQPNHTGLPTSFKVFLSFLSLAILCILVRCVYRIYELSNGYSGPLIRNQGLFIGLEGV